MARSLVVLGSVTLAVVLALAWSERRGSVTPVAVSTTVARSIEPTASSGDAPARNATRHVSGVPVSWRVLSDHTSARIQNEYLPATAKGIYLIMDVSATNKASTTVTVGNDVIELNLDGTVYQPSTNGVTALELGGDRLLSDLVLDPGATGTGWVAFDVPPSSAGSSPQLCLDQPAEHAAC
jgi:Domain of unknown function (DUF4352)